MNMDNYKDQSFDDLIIKLLTNEITHEEYDTLQKWLLQDKNKEYFNKFRKIWQASGRKGGQNKFNNLKGWTQIKSRAGISDEDDNQKKSKSFFSVIKIAAAILMLISGTALLTWYFTSRITIQQEIPEITSISSPLGSKCRIVLPDSTVVWLNADSKISYAKNFNESERRLFLEGEAFFDVTTNKEKPFMVQTSDILVRALGTKFNVKAYPEENEITTTLEEGKVDIQLLNGKNISEDIVLKPNEKVVYHKSSSLMKEEKSGTANNTESTDNKPINTERIEINSNVNTELYTSWKDKRWILEGENLEAFAKILERRYNITIMFNDDELRQVKFTGIIENETIEQLMEALRLTSPLAFEMSKDTIWLNLDKQLDKKYKRFKIINQIPK